MHTFTSETATWSLSIKNPFKHRKSIIRTSLQIQPTDSVTHPSNITQVLVFQTLPRIWIFSIILEGLLLWDERSLRRLQDSLLFLNKLTYHNSPRCCSALQVCWTSQHGAILFLLFPLFFFFLPTARKKRVFSKATSVCSTSSPSGKYTPTTSDRVFS